MRRPVYKSRWFKIIAFIVLFPYVLAIPYLIVPPVSTLMLARLVAFQEVKRDWVPLKRISPHLIAAVIASEDGAFCGHFGFDFYQIEKSVGAAMDGNRLRGASTITQQTVKNLFLWNGRSVLRKMLEAPLALWVELIWPKRRVLEVYLNIAEWGPGVFGAEAAARYHFGLSSHELSLRQAALLAAMLPSPRGRISAGQQIQAGVIERRAATRRPDLSCLK